MDLKEKYVIYRKRLLALHMQILTEFVSDKDFLKSAEILGVLNKDNKIVIDYTFENDALYDFNIYETIIDGSNALSKFLKKCPPGNKMDEGLLLAMNTSEVGLYEITDHDQENGIIILTDVLNDSIRIKLIDIGMSEHLNPKILLFTRLIHLDEFSMTSGLAFAFSIDHKDYLIKKSSKIMRNVNGFNESVARFIAFFTLNRTNGIPVQLEEVK